MIRVSPCGAVDVPPQIHLTSMKLLKYALVLAVALAAISCVDEPIGPLQDEDIIIVPPPPKP